jgi:hypothetical protein
MVFISSARSDRTSAWWTRPGNGSVRSPGGETVPQGYADAVAEYFRKLSKSK